MPLEDFLRALDTIPADHRPRDFSVVLTGGEPLLRPDIAEAGREIRRRGFGWGMVTNGWCYDEAMHGKLMAAGMGAVTVSLDGLETSHDWMRGVPGSYQRALRAIGIIAAEPRLNADVVTCVNRRNLSELPEIYEILKGLGVKQWRLFTIIPIGRAAADPEMKLADSQFVSLMEFIQAKRREGGPMKVTFSCEGYLGRYEEKVRDIRYFCRAGINIASVLIDGRICACPNIDRDRFSQGSIYTDNFYEVWENRFEAFRKRDWARSGRCKDCKAWRDCLYLCSVSRTAPGPAYSSRTMPSMRSPRPASYRSTAKTSFRLNSCLRQDQSWSGLPISSGATIACSSASSGSGDGSNGVPSSRMPFR